MKRPLFLTLCFAFVVFLAAYFVVSMPGSWGETLTYPFRALLGTSHELNARLLDVSESPETIRVASQRLLQPFGVVRLVQIYDIPESELSQEPKGLQR